MNPDEDCIDFLKTNQYYKNYDCTSILINNKIALQNYICYCVGSIEDRKFVHCIRILKKSNETGISAYFINWWHIDLSHYISFWVHSGIALRKYFFLYEDRLSFLRSTFIYHQKNRTYYRLSHIIDYLDLPIEAPMYMKIFSTPCKQYTFTKIHQKDPKQKKKKQKKLKQYLTKNLKQFCKHLHHQSQLRESYPNLFQEIDKIVDNE
jgi:hypothetical protein